MSLNVIAPPTIIGYTNWLRTFMGVPDTILPDDSPYLQMSFDIAMEFVNYYINIVNPGVFTLAVYNLSGATLAMIAQDDPTLPPPDNTYWADLRQSLNLNTFIPGFVNNASDQGTSAGIQILQSMAGLTIGDLQLLQSPWGRSYLAIAQCVGTIWGIT
jgi:hypothetical protein